MALPWLRAYSETYEDCVAGNREGLTALRESIDEAIAGREGPQLDERFNSDLSSVVLVAEDRPPNQFNDRSTSKVTCALLSFASVIWLIVLPVFGIYGIYVLLTR